MTQRFATNMVFMSLLLSSEVAVLFSPSTPADVMRERLKNEEYGTYDFWAGALLCISIFVTLSSLVATFTAWAIVSSLGDHNAHCVLRSSVGLYTAQLPSRLIVTALYLFLSWMVFFMFILLPKSWAIGVTVCCVTLFVHVVSIYSSLGRLVIHTGAMGPVRVFPVEEEEAMPPFELFENLIKNAKTIKKQRMNITTHYKTIYRSRTSSGENGVIPDLGENAEVRSLAQAAEQAAPSES